MKPLLLLCGLAFAAQAPTSPVLAASSVTSLTLPGSYGLEASGRSEDNLSRWWQSLGDPALAALIEQALSANTDVDVAAARVRQARASLSSANADFFPNVTLSASATREDKLGESGTARDLFSQGFDASYELDLFGRVQHNNGSARASYHAAIANLHDVQRILAAEVALNYFQYQLSSERLDIAQRNLGFQTETRNIARWREQAGLGNALDAAQAEAQLSQTAATIPALESAQAQSANRLATLLGLPAGALTDRLAPIKTVSAPLPIPEVGVPAQLLERRPDIISARLAVLSAAESVGVAKAALLPTLRLGGSITTSAATSAGLFDTMIGTLIARLTGPIFNAGRLRANVTAARAQADIATANYRASVLNAFEETRNAIVGQRAALTRATHYADAEAASQTARRLASSQYEAGLIDFQKLLEADRALLSSEDSLATARADQSRAAVQLYKALGGGWDNSPAQP